ncbi:transcriptional regulator, TetR family [Lentzea xinjiangensis]|uniref:Transcriptional regulator, TetR family n=1 Tax=Lentzea xinjiangensis TaxID=402600 RepID=A0A1H9NHU5_9PSEU|nr:TetR/AcrR family transcriptional regulator [Lentzea xinjiangensis]SER35488.1 transcriptional regulator, TetR family [Lentzea xinjiangensis]
MSGHTHISGAVTKPTEDKQPSRPRNAAGTREQLLKAAAALFARNGYEATTVSQIAQAAGFSANLVTRYFGGKEGLFLAAMETRLNLESTLPGSIDSLGQRLADRIVDRWEREGDADPLLALLRSASSRPAALGDFLEKEATGPLTKALMSWGFSDHQAVDTANAIQSFIVGTVVTRRMLNTGAIAAATGPQLRVWLADVLQRLVDEGATAESPRLPHPSASSDAR